MRLLDTGADDLQTHVEDGTAVLLLHRPKRRSALTPAMVVGLARVLPEVEVDDEVGAVVLTGAGGAFCAGGDVKSMAKSGPLPVHAALERQRHDQR